MLMQYPKSLEDLQKEGFERIISSGCNEIYCKHDEIGNPQKLARYNIVEEKITIWKVDELQERGLWL